MNTLRQKLRNRQLRWKLCNTLLKTALLVVLSCLIPQVITADPSSSSSSNNSPVPMIIPQISLVMASPIHPQVLILIGNSQSMDGTLSGAIMTGSGSLSSNLLSLDASSSPFNYIVPEGFTPPLQGANGYGQAPYTVVQNGLLVDNGPSRLNVAKAGVEAIIKTYMQTTDFGLATYNTSGSVYNTWVYLMSPQGENFSFRKRPPPGSRYVNNPCYNYLLSSSTILSNCLAIDALYTNGGSIATKLYMIIGASSDDPTINDVLYAGGGFPGVFDTYSGPYPSTPFPPNFSLGNYNYGNIVVSYNSSAPNIGGFGTAPTNAGYVPYSQQVMYSQRGFGYYGYQASNTGSILVPMSSAGTSPTNASVTAAINLFLPFLMPETNSTGTTEIKDSATQSPTAGLLTQANNYLKVLGTTSGNGCPQKKYVILISDGLPTEDLQGLSWPPLGSASAVGYGVTATFNSDGSLKTTNDQALTDAISQINALQSNGVSTYVIGLGAGVNPSVNPDAAATLTAMAVAGGTNNYYPATDPTALVNSLNTIMVSIQNGSFTTSAASVSSTQLNNGAVEYIASFVSNDSLYLDWTGNLTAEALSTTTGFPTGTVIWTARGLLDNLVAGTGWANNRVIATWNPVTQLGVPFEWADISTTQQSQLQPSDLLGLSRLQYVRGDSALEKHSGGTFRNRTHILGDIIDSQVIFVGPPQSAYLTASYLTFKSTQSARQSMLYVGSNDGMLHAFNAATGKETFAFIPNAVFHNLYYLTTTLYNQSHLFFVDGSPQSGDVQFSDNTWHTVLVGGENAGGNSVYALDITNPSYNSSSEGALANSVLWEFTDIDLGLTYSIPQIAQIGTDSTTPLTFAVFFGNGYNSPNNNSVFYAVNPQTGALLAKINLCTVQPSACNPNAPQGLSSVTVANIDGIQGEPITVVYAGDLQGNLWAINVTNASPVNWTARLLFQARDSLGNPQPITTTPVVTLNPNYPRHPGLFLMFGTGQLLTANDLLNTQTQTIYGVWDEPLASSSFTRANLQQQTLNLISVGQSGLTEPILTVTTTAINWTNLVGWYADLPTPGQRTITTPALLNGVFIDTLNTPPLSQCGTAFTSMLLELNYQTGGSFLQAQLDVTGSGNLTNQPQFGGTYAVGIQLSNSYANAPTILGTNKNNNAVILITQANGNQSPEINPNNIPRRIGWWQLQ